VYKPISFTVIRQAIAWQGIPSPLSIRMLSTFKWPDGSTSAEIIATWDSASVMAFTGYASLYDGGAAYTAFLSSLRECFCDDVCPVTAHYEVTTDRMSVELHCVVSAHGFGQLALSPLVLS